ncbi:MAG TPA: right-handed parallel beta-helix repeat-containing protein [Candidatus Saccharimonadales bacterium]|nr:right-handed parallel beta-helix repeat-containing protein [Candidatus Saccharimonadales bacterium]
MSNFGVDRDRDVTDWHPQETFDGDEFADDYYDNGLPWHDETTEDFPPANGELRGEPQDTGDAPESRTSRLRRIGRRAAGVLLAGSLIAGGAGIAIHLAPPEQKQQMLAFGEERFGDTRWYGPLAELLSREPVTAFTETVLSPEPVKSGRPDSSIGEPWRLDEPDETEDTPPADDQAAQDSDKELEKEDASTEPSPQSPASAALDGVLAFPPGDSPGLPEAPQGWELPPSPEIADAAQFQVALDNAVPGTFLRLKPGVTYEGNFTLARASEAGRRIVIDTSGALLKAKDPNAPVLDIRGADYLYLTGFSSDGGTNGIRITQTDRYYIKYDRIANTSEIGIHAFDQSRDGIIDTQGGVIENTGQEGIFLGSFTQDMNDAGGILDQTDRNLIFGNGAESIRGTAAESIEIAEGTTGNRIEGVRMNGAAIVDGAGCMFNLGRGTSISDTVCVQVPQDRDAIRVERVPEIPGSGEGGTYGNNRIQSSEELAPGRFVVAVQEGITQATVICDQTIPQEKLSNILCKAGAELAEG